jgi:hypothetical protein
MPINDAVLRPQKGSRFNQAHGVIAGKAADVVGVLPDAEPWGEDVARRNGFSF